MRIAAASIVAMGASIGALGVAVGAGCSQEIPPEDPGNLDRPSDLAFACIGELVLDNGDTVRSAQPMANCFGPAQGEPDAGSPAVAPGIFGFALQTEMGTVALIDMTLGSVVGGLKGFVIDSDPLVPRKNAVPVGTLPVSIVTDESGCHVIIGNAGTCDLSVLDPRAAIDQEPSVTRHAVINAAGDVVEAEPRVLVAEPPGPAANVECAADPTGLLYIAYPHCNAVAVVDPSGGMYEVVASIVFAADGTPSIGDGALSCPAECGGADPTAGPIGVDAGSPDAGIPDAGTPPGPDAAVDPPVDHGTPRPVSLLLSRDGTQLFVAAENAPRLTIVDLDGEHMPVSLTTIGVEGDVGLRRMAHTGPIEMGSELGTASFGTRAVGEFNFVYAIATDRTIRVIELDDRMECDTQVDPRFVHDSRSAGEFACFEVGAITTPPRRPGVSGPGIVMPRNSVPVDIQTFDTARDKVEGDTRSPTAMVGHFAMAVTSDGFAHVLNIDDDHYPDFEVADDPIKVHLPLAMAHRVRDNVTLRQEPANTCSLTVNSGHPDNERGPRALNGVLRAFDTEFISINRGDALLPRGRNVECLIVPDSDNPEETGLRRDAVSELDFAAPADVRELAFPDVAAARNEEFLIAWEGLLSLDESTVAIDGPINRVGIVFEDGPDVLLVDGGAPFCEMGAEPYDVVQMLGCQFDSHCSVGEECVFHPDSTVNTGLCFPSGLANPLVSRCRDLLVSTKQYTAVETFSGHLTLVERRLLLRTGPVDGCVSDDECDSAATRMPSLLLEDDPRAEIPELPAKCDESGTECVPFTWACADDPSRKPGPNKCLMTCGELVDDVTGQVSECPDGAWCSDGFCVSAPLPEDECMRALQRYNVRAGEAFSVVGGVVRSASVTGYVHNRIVDPDTGQCIDDPDGNPLNIGRFPITGLPDCAGDGIDDVSPNPCMTIVTHGVEIERTFDSETAECVVIERDSDENGDLILRTQEVPAIRFRNPVFTMHIVRPTTTGDGQCFGDEEGILAPFSPLYPGYAMSVRVSGGFLPLVAPVDVVLPARLVKGPTGALWLLDQGDGTRTAGQIIHIDPSAPTAVIDGTSIIR